MSTSMNRRTFVAGAGAAAVGAMTASMAVAEESAATAEGAAESATVDRYEDPLVKNGLEVQLEYNMPEGARYLE